MTERDRLLRKKQDADERWQLQHGRMQRLQQTQFRETRVEEQERLESVIRDARRLLDETESEQRTIESQLTQLDTEARSSRPAAPPMGVGTPSRAELRQLMESLFLSDADLEAFCIDHCADVQNRFALGMEPRQKHNLLLTHLPEAELFRRLMLHSPHSVSRLLDTIRK